MRKPEVTPENAAALYDYYADLEPNPRLTSLTQFLSRKAFKPTLHYEGDAEQQLEDLVLDGTRLILTSNHIAIGDQFVVGSALQQNEVLKSIPRNVFVAAKPSYFKGQKRRFFDGVGAIPTFRPKDVGDDAIRLREPTERFMGVGIKKLREGKHFFVFGQGERRPNHFGTIERGLAMLARMAEREDEPIPVAITSIGISYPLNKQWNKKGYLHPYVVIDEPYLGPFRQSRKTLEIITTNMHKAARLAIEINPSPSIGAEAYFEPSMDKKRQGPKSLSSDMQKP